MTRKLADQEANVDELEVKVQLLSDDVRKVADF